MKFSYKQFKNYLQRVDAMIAFEDQLRDATHELRDNNIDADLFMPSLIDDVVDLLAIVTHDEDEWISYWVYELDCGRKYKDRMITASDGTNIRCKTIRDLWNIIIENNQNSMKTS